MGDINCDVATTSRDPTRPTFQFLYDAYQFQQLISDYTRVTENSSTLIDHLITNKPENIISSEVVKINVSDHYLISGIRKCQVVKANPRYVEYRNMKHFNPTLFIKDLQNIQWNLFEVNDVNEMVHIWETLYLEIFNKHAPLCKRRVRNRSAPWLTPSIKSLMHERDFHKKQ